MASPLCTRSGGQVSSLGAGDRGRDAHIAEVGVCDVNSRYVPQSVNLTSDPLCGLHERPVFPLRDGIGFYANAAYSALRAHAAQNTNSHFGLDAVIRLFCSDDSYAPLSSRLDNENRTFRLEGPLLAIADIGQNSVYDRLAN
jgi:hypothetical protein